MNPDDSPPGVKPGRFIAFEGGEGAGKSTQAARLVRALHARGHAVLATREPGGTPGAERVRALVVEEDGYAWDPVSEALLYFAARREHVEKTIRPALAEGTWVISDRFADSTLAYQGYGAGGPIEAIGSIGAAVLGAFQPDLTLILDIEAATGLERARARSPGGDRYERQPLVYHRRLREGFLEIAKNAPERCVVIDARGDEAATAASVLEAVDRRLPEAVR